MRVISNVCDDCNKHYAEVLRDPQTVGVISRMTGYLSGWFTAQPPEENIK